MNIYKQKFKEVLFSIFPITIIVMILNFTLTPLEIPLIIRFIIGAFLIIIGLSIFLIGVDIAITPLGSQVGAAFAKSNKIWIVIIGGLIVGFFISIAEPGLIILANQVGIVTSGQISSISILSIVSIGLAIMLAAGFVRIVFNIPLYKILTVLYGLVLILALFTPVEFLTIAFDASGATTGILAVPFILALAVGISSMKKDSKASEKDSFGLVAIALVIWIFFKRNKSSEKDNSGALNIGTSIKKLIKIPRYALGVIAQFFYVGVQIAVWTWTIGYVMTTMGLDEAAGLIMAILGGAVITPFMGKLIDTGSLASIVPAFTGAEAAIRSSFLVPVVCFAVVLVYSLIYREKKNA